MGKRLPHTPKSQIRNALRQLWLRSRERAAALRNAGHACEHCGAKFRAKTTRNGPACKGHVHHKDGIDWDGITDLIAQRILHHPDRLQALCDECHGAEHETNGKA